MVIRVLLFGAEADAAGAREVSVDVGSNATCAGVKASLGAAVPKIAAMIRTARIAVNAEFAREDTVIKPGDEVAVIGMVSGG